jgi:hypothetical protein
MQYVVLDTNAWINLANGTDPSRMLLALHRGVMEGEVIVILPTVIIDEWEKGKHKLLLGGSLKTFDEISKGFGTLLKSISKDESFSHIEENDFVFEDPVKVNIWELFKGLSANFNNGRKIVENLIKENASLIDEIFEHYSTRRIEIKNSVALKAAKFAVAKKAPFGNKNSFIDALILFSFIEYAKINHLYYTHFVTYNVDDFCEKRNQKYFLHKDLVEEFDKSGVEFHQSVAAALNSIYQNVEYQNGEFFDYLNEIKFYETASEAIEKEEESIFREATCTQCLHPIYFHRIDLSDINTVVSKQQLEFDFVKDIVPRKSKHLFSRITAGICAYCESEYFVCVGCDELNEFDDDRYYSHVECKNRACNFPYYVTPGALYENFGRYLNNYYVLVDKKICQECSNVFQDDGLGSVLCSDCSNYHYYDDLIQTGFVES